MKNYTAKNNLRFYVRLQYWGSYFWDSISGLDLCPSIGRLFTKYTKNLQCLTKWFSARNKQIELAKSDKWYSTKKKTHLSIESFQKHMLSESYSNQLGKFRRSKLLKDILVSQLMNGRLVRLCLVSSVIFTFDTPFF
jgi:hypothetical protein